MKVGEVAALFRYPVKSMGGEALASAELGWHGIDGDRRLAFRRADDRGGFPWLTATKLPELILFTPQRHGASGDSLPTHVRTPEGNEHALFSQELASEVGRRHGSPVEMTHLDRGIFDDASISVITTATVGALGTLAGRHLDIRRFRPNVVIETSHDAPFEEDEWVGGVLTFGEPAEAAVIGITHRDERCAMVNYDPDTAEGAPEIMRAIVRERDNKAGVYAAVTRRGRLAVGQPVYFDKR
jgi:uncharacterized protein YcbX